MARTVRGDGREQDVPLRALKCFIEVAGSDRFADAASRLGVTSSAISHQLRALEDWIGGELLDRSTKKPTLTALGRTLRNATAGPLKQIDRALLGIRRLEDRSSLVISAPPAFVSFRLIPALSGFKQAHPQIKIDFRLARFDAEIEPFEADIAIRFMHGHASAKRIGVPGWRAVCTPGYFRSLGNPQRLGDLAEATLLHEEIYNFWPEAFRTKALPVPPGVTFRALGDASHVLSSLLAGDAIALLPNELTRGLRRSGALVSPFEADIEPQAAYYAVTAARPDGNPSLDAVMGWLDATD